MKPKLSIIVSISLKNNGWSNILGESWLGLEKLHQLTSEGSYSLHITLKDFDQKTYVAVYDQFQVIMTLKMYYKYVMTGQGNFNSEEY